jgi:hypothetical protein
MPYLSLTLGDSFGRTTRKLVEMEEAASLALYVNAANAFIDELENVTDLSVVRSDLILDGLLHTFAVTEGANVDVGATFSGYIYDGDGKKASFKLPGIKLSLVDPDGSVPITDDVEDLLGFFIDIPEENSFRLSDGESIGTWIKGTLDK